MILSILYILLLFFNGLKIGNVYFKDFDYNDDIFVGLMLLSSIWIMGKYAINL